MTVPGLSLPCPSLPCPSVPCPFVPYPSIPSMPFCPIPHYPVPLCAMRRCDLVSLGHASTPFTSLLFESQHPLPLAAFQHIVATRLRGRGASSNKNPSGTASSSTTSGCAPVKGLLRAKGFLYFKELRHLRFVFQLSGSSRCSCTAIDTWDCPPSCRLVLIGQDAAELAGLVSELESLAEDHKTDDGGEGWGDGVLDVVCETGSRNVAAEVVCGKGSAAAEAARLVEMLTADERFELRTSNRGGKLTAEIRGRTCSTSLVEFGMKSIPLKGIHQNALNASLLAYMNNQATQPVFVCSTLPTLNAGPLILGMRASSEVEMLFDLLSIAARRSLSQALKNVSSCRCDVVHDMVNTK
ncbi:unnamed protein product [Closterium sp. Yama58-4]|nr:unnamed protein product [Closterium sp. Yama58-4]